MDKRDFLELVKQLSRSVPWWTPNRQVRFSLSVSESTRKVDTNLLVELGAIQSKDRRSGYNRQEFLALLAFREVQSLSDRDTAADTIANNLEIFTNDYSSRSEARTA